MTHYMRRQEDAFGAHLECSCGLLSLPIGPRWKTMPADGGRKSVVALPALTPQDVRAAFARHMEAQQ